MPRKPSSHDPRAAPCDSAVPYGATAVAADLGFLGRYAIAHAHEWGKLTVALETAGVKASKATVSRDLRKGKLRKKWWVPLAGRIGFYPEIFAVLNFLDQIPAISATVKRVDPTDRRPRFDTALSGWHALAQSGQHLLLAGDIMMKAIDVLADIQLDGKSVVIYGLDIRARSGEPAAVLATKAKYRLGDAALAPVLHAKLLTALFTTLMTLAHKRPADFTLTWVVRETLPFQTGGEPMRSSYVLANEHLALERIPTLGNDCTADPFDVSWPGQASWEGMSGIQALRNRLTAPLLYPTEKVLFTYRDRKIYFEEPLRDVLSQAHDALDASHLIKTISAPACP